MKILITAGPTREAIDPVRYLSNRSSGKMGYAIAEAAALAGHEVLVVSGPVSISVPANVEVVQVESAQQMFDAVADRIDAMDAVVMAAAVSDYRPAQAATEKIKKTENELTLTLQQTPDILGSARSVFGFGGLLVGFAAETNGIATNAREKLERKGCDMIVANDVSRPDIGFDSENNAVTLFFSDGNVQEIPLASKADIGCELIRHFERMLTNSG